MEHCINCEIMNASCEYTNEILKIQQAKIDTLSNMLQQVLHESINLSTQECIKYADTSNTLGLEPAVASVEEIPYNTNSIINYCDIESD